MKRKLILSIAIIIFSLVQVIFSQSTVRAATFENGTYDIPFELKETGSNNASIADGYFSKPAKLSVENGANYIQLTTTQSDWVKSISGPYGNGSVISESGKTRTVKLQVDDLNNAITLQMHVVVPKEIAGMEYDNHHSVRAVFNTDGIPLASDKVNDTRPQQTDEDGAAETNNNSTSQSQEKNPQTGDTSPIDIYLTLLLLSIGTFILYQVQLARKQA